LRAVALDKTGTLTAGTPQVVEVEPLENHTEQELLKAMGAIEAHSDHPLARAIVAHVQAKGITWSPASEVQSVQGRGVTAAIDGKRYWLGSHRYLEELQQETPELHTRIEAMSSAGRTVVVMGRPFVSCTMSALSML
jgi:Cd2+/Zn2+-exporting ATPase